jgi:DNA-binding transcriptional regulator YiaG
MSSVQSRVVSPTVVDVAKARQRLPTPVERRRIRERARVSQAALGRPLGVSGACVSLWEREHGGREPRGERLVGYVLLLDELDQLVGDE